VAFLVRLHALLIGDHDAEADSYGLGPLERNLLALAIRKVYADSTEPGESALHQTLTDLAATEDADTAGVYRNLAHRLSEFCADGTYGALFDRPTTIQAEDAPLVVFNTRKVPDDVAAPCSSPSWSSSPAAWSAATSATSDASPTAFGPPATSTVRARWSSRSSGS
jgi:hypothetical protein